MSLKPIKLLYWRSEYDELSTSRDRNGSSVVANTPTDQVPNPSKVLIILEELNLPYESSWVELEGLKQKPYTDVNPNGRVPAIVDPNHNTTLWESGAIVQMST